MLEDRTEVIGRLSLNPQHFPKLNSGQERIFDRSKIPIWYSEIAQHWRWHRKKHYCIVRDSFSIAHKRHHERLFLADATGTVRLSLSVRSEWSEIWIRGAHCLRVQLLCCCQHVSKTSSVTKLLTCMKK